MIYGDIADLYFDMGHYELSINYWFRFLNLVSKKNYSIAYNGLGTSYFYLGNVDMAGFYFNEQLAHVQDASKVYIDDNMMQYFDEVVNHKKEYKIVYPYECVDYSEAVERGKRKILQGDYAGAIEILSEVYPGSDRYADALCELELAYFFSGKLQEAVSAGRKALVYRPDCVRALCTLASIYHYCGQYEQAALCLKRAEEAGSDADDDVYKLATTLCEQAKHKKALFYLEKLIGRNPYETKILFLAGSLPIIRGIIPRPVRISAKFSASRRSIRLRSITIASRMKWRRSAPKTQSLWRITTGFRTRSAKPVSAACAICSARRSGN